MKGCMLPMVVALAGLMWSGCGGSSGGGAPISSSSPTAPVSTLTVTSSALPSGKVGVAYSFQLEANGGTPPYKWGNQSNQQLPSGLNLSPSGLISGMPTAAGTTIVGFTIGDSGNPSQNTVRDLQLVVGP